MHANPSTAHARAPITDHTEIVDRLSRTSGLKEFVFDLLDDRTGRLQGGFLSSGLKEFVFDLLDESTSTHDLLREAA